MRGYEVVEEGGGGAGVGDNMHGWTSVGHGVDLFLSYNTAHSKKRKKKQTNTIQGDNEGEPRNKRSQYKLIKLFHCINRSENKLTIHLLDFYRHFPLNHEVRA